MVSSSKRIEVAIRALEYASDYLSRIDVDCLNPTVSSGVSEVINDLNGLISLQISDLPF